MDRITDRLHIDDLESRINVGIDNIQVGEVIIRSPQYLKSNMFATDGEGVDFEGLVFPYNILTHI